MRARQAHGTGSDHLRTVCVPRQTTAERGFGVFAEFCRDFILGLVASLITTISMAMSNNDNETNIRLKGLKLWMQQRYALPVCARCLSLYCPMRGHRGKLVCRKLTSGCWYTGGCRKASRHGP